jgi:hypothetical protein
MADPSQGDFGGLVNYYPPGKRSPADDALWTNFVAGIVKK